MYKNPIIVFEGIEGSGKTFHINNVSRYLKKRKVKYIKIREPGGTTNSEKIRKLILNSKNKLKSYIIILLLTFVAGLINSLSIFIIILFPYLSVLFP